MKLQQLTYEQAKEKWPTSHPLMTESNEYHQIVHQNMMAYNEAIADMEKLKKPKRDKLPIDYDCCDVKRCRDKAASGGTHWRKTGYWRICMDHGEVCRNGGNQPEMKHKSVEREKTRGADGCLPDTPQKRDKLTQVDNGTCSMSEIYKLAEKIQSVSNFVDAILRDTRSMFPELQSRIDQLETLHENHCIATAHQRDNLFDRLELLEHQSKDMGNGIDDSLQRVEKLEQFNKCQIVTNSVDLKYLEDYENRISKLETQMAVIHEGDTEWQKSVIRDGDAVRIITSDRTVIHQTK